MGPIVTENPNLTYTAQAGTVSFVYNKQINIRNGTNQYTISTYEHYF